MRILFTIITLSLFVLHAKAQFSATGTHEKYTDQLAGTDIEAVFIYKSLSGATLTYKSTKSNLDFYTYQNSESDKVPVTPTPTQSTEGGITTYIIANPEDGRGYIPYDDQGKSQKSAWVINYSQHHPTLTSIEPQNTSDECKNLKLLINNSVDQLYCNAKNGLRKFLPRNFELTYETMEYNTTTKRFETKPITLVDLTLGTEILIAAPLKDTKFTLTGDQFAKKFSVTTSIQSATYKAIAVAGHIESVREDTGGGNTTDITPDPLGGAGPAIVNFYGAANEPTATHYTWLIFRGNDMVNPISRFTDKDIRYEFDQAGEFTVKLEVASSSCVDTISIYKFTLMGSFVDPPNYFSPGDSPGINDEFRVAYRSLKTFKCTIFNRWGTKLYEFTDPAKGWDGRYGGKYVATGVYFYVIVAKGIDGNDIKKSGDINIVRKNK